MAITDTGESALLSGPAAADNPKTSQIVEVARRFGVSPFRQLREMMTLRFGRAKLDFSEYYSYGVYNTAIPMERKSDFVGETSSRAINNRLSPPKLAIHASFMRDKVLYTALVQQMGFRTTRTQAAVHAYRGFGDVPALRNAKEIREFLLTRATYPLFGKPCEGHGSVGSAMIVGIDRESETLTLGNRRRIALGMFCDEVIRDHPEGFIFQDCLQQAPEIENMIGTSVGTVRVVTLRDSETPRVLYSLWKLPSPSAMSDNFWQSGSMIAAINVESGQIEKVRRGSGMEGEWIESHPVSGHSFSGFQIPHWEAVLDQVKRAHALFPEFGVVGWDIGVTPAGPAIIEANPNPLHSLWQVANGRGFDRPEISASLEQTAALSRKMLSEGVTRHNNRMIAKNSKG